MANYLADNSYLAVKPQVAAATPIIPTIFLPLMSESIRVNPNFNADRRIKALNWKSDDLLKGFRSVEGDIVILGDPTSMGHVLNMAMLKGTTTGDATNGFTHPFTVGEGKSYSLEIGRGVYAQRFYGVRANSIKLDYIDNKLQATINIRALGQFYTASLAIALTGAGMTTAVLSTNYDLRPSDGLVVGDFINVGGVNVALTSVNADGKTLGFASTSITAAVGDPVSLVAQTASYGTQLEPFYLGNTLVGFAATAALAATAAAARTTATPCYSFILTLLNNLLTAPASGYTGAAVILNQVKEGSLEVGSLFETPQKYQEWLENVKRGCVAIATGRFIKTDLTTSEKLTLTLNNVKKLTNEQPLEVGSYIQDRQKFEMLYDATDVAAFSANLVNRTAGTVY